MSVLFPTLSTPWEKEKPFRGKGEEKGVLSKSMTYSFLSVYSILRVNEKKKKKRKGFILKLVILKTMACYVIVSFFFQGRTCLKLGPMQHSRTQIGIASVESTNNGK